MELVASTEQDIEQIKQWAEQDIDPTHRSVSPVWWITGNGILCYKIVDSQGVTMYVRTEADNNMLRLHTQFGPESQVSKIRVIKSLLWALPKMEVVGKQFELTGFVFRSQSGSLIDFMTLKFGFESLSGDDYCKRFDRG